MFTMVVEVDSGYRDAGQRLDDARRRQQSAGLQAEARQLYQAEQWAAVVKIGEQLSILDPADADPEGLVSSARAQLASAERAAQEASEYRRGLRLLDAGEWQQAIEALEGLDHTYRDVAALLARARREVSVLTPSPLPRPRSPTPDWCRACGTARRSTPWRSARAGNAWPLWAPTRMRGSGMPAAGRNT